MPRAPRSPTPQFYQYSLDTAEISEVWRRGSVIGSWLLDLTAAALHEDPELERFRGRVSDSGEGRWTAQAAVDNGVPAHVLTAALVLAIQLTGATRTLPIVLLCAMRNSSAGTTRSPTPTSDQGRRCMARLPRSDALVLFGITGDLARKKFFPSLYRLAERGRLDMPIVGVARSTWDNQALVDHAYDCDLGARGSIDETVFARLAEQLSHRRR